MINNTPEPRQPRVLLVDDEPDTLQLLRKILQADGYQISQATNGLEALELLEREKPDLILLDVVMPGMDGMAVLETIRQRDPITGVIMVSALSSEELLVRAMFQGADDFVNKPFALKHIRIRIRQTLEKSRLRRENLSLQNELRIAHDKLRTLFSRYLAQPVVEQLLASPSLPSLGGERQITTVLFMDFCDFTSMSHQLEPDKVLHVLNEHLGIVTHAILEENGTIDKFIGDGAMALFNAPVPQEDHAERAVRTALAIRDRIIAWSQNHNPALSVRIGLHTGETVVGNIGTQELMNYTAIGDTVNLAKRLQEESESNTIIISDTTYRLLPENFAEITPLGTRVVKGRRTPVQIYRLERLLTN